MIVVCCRRVVVVDGRGGVGVGVVVVAVVGGSRIAKQKAGEGRAEQSRPEQSRAMRTAPGERRRRSQPFPSPSLPCTSTPGCKTYDYYSTIHTITGNHSKWDQILFLKIGKHTGFCVYRRSY